MGAGKRVAQQIVQSRFSSPYLACAGGFSRARSSRAVILSDKLQGECSIANTARVLVRKPAFC